MNSFRNTLLTKATLAFFLAFLLNQPVYAGKTYFADQSHELLATQQTVPVIHLNSVNPDQFISSMQRAGYTVMEAEPDDLMRLTAAQSAPENVDPPAIPKDRKTVALSKQECEKIREKLKKPDQDSTAKPVPPNRKMQYENECGKYFHIPQPVPPAPVEPQPEVQVNTGIYADISASTGGSNSDAAKILFIFVGIVFVAAFVIYAGKYVTDMLRGEDQKYWWEFVFDSKFLDADRGEHGTFTGIKIATGPVSSELLQLALILEIGNADLDLIMNKPENPQPLDVTATYWLLGGTIRLHLSDKLVNPSYLYLEMMGGSTSHSDTELIGLAKGGINFGIDKTMRLGFSIGSQYIGLNEDKGFTNDGDNFWFTYGLEFGVRF